MQILKHRRIRAGSNQYNLMRGRRVEIRRAELSDWDAIWEIWHAVVADGTTLVYAPDTSKEEAFPLWMTPPAVPYVAVEGAQIVGSYIIKPNQPGLGSIPFK